MVRGPGTRDFARTCLARWAEARGGYRYKMLAGLALFHVSWPDVSIHIEPLSPGGAKSEMDTKALVKPEACSRSYAGVAIFALPKGGTNRGGL